MVELIVYLIVGNCNGFERLLLWSFKKAVIYRVPIVKINGLAIP